MQYAVLHTLWYSKWKPRSCLPFKHHQPSCISSVRTSQRVSERAIRSPLINVSRVFLKTYMRFREDFVPGFFWPFCAVRESNFISQTGFNIQKHTASVSKYFLSETVRKTSAKMCSFPFKEETQFVFLDPDHLNTQAKFCLLKQSTGSS